jgi:hypothetical protein
MTMAIRKARGRTGVSLGSVTVAAFTALALLLPAAASAHRVTSAVPNCTSVHLVYESTQGTTFSGTVFTDNGTVAATWSHVAGVDIATSGTLDVPYAHPAGPFTMYARWQFSTGESSGLNRVSMDCTPAAPPPAAPPAVTPPASPAATSPAVTSPSSNVAGVEARSPARVARVAVASVCASHTAQVTVTGRSMRDVTLSVNGRRIKTIRIAPGRTVVRTSVPIASGRAQKVSARVRFRNGAAPRTLVNRAVRCAQTAVQPQFTG